MFANYILAAAIALFAGGAFAAEPQVTFSDMAVREPAGAVAVGYFTATSTAEDAITGVMSDCCSAIELHRTEKLNGVMSMRKLPALALAKGKTVAVQPGSKGGEHLMLIGLSKKPKAGDVIEITFSFKKAPSQTVRFPVIRAEGQGNAQDHSH